MTAEELEISSVSPLSTKAPGAPVPHSPEEPFSTEAQVSAELVKHNHKSFPIAPSHAAFERNSVYFQKIFTVWMSSLQVEALRNTRS